MSNCYLIADKRIECQAGWESWPCEKWIEVGTEYVWIDDPLLRHGVNMCKSCVEHWENLPRTYKPGGSNGS